MPHALPCWRELRFTFSHFFAPVVFLLLVSCAPHKQPPSYDHALTLFRRGELAQAREEVQQAAARCGSDQYCRWQCRILLSEILIYLSHDKDARTLLKDGPPGTPEFARLAVRRNMLLGYYHLDAAPGPSSDQLDESYRQAIRLGLTDLLPEIEILQARRLFDSGRTEEARAAVLQARQQAVEQHDPYNEAAALNNLGMMSLVRSRFDEAIPWFEKTLEPARRAGASPLVTAAYNNLALCYTQLGAYDQALKLQQEANVWLGAGEILSVRRDLLGEMGRTLALKGDTRRAIEYYRQALDLTRKLNDGSVDTLSNLASALAELGDWDAAAQVNREELVLCRDDRSRAFATVNTAVIAAGRKQFENSIAQFQKALLLNSRDPDPSIVWESHAGLARAYASVGDKRLARDNFQKAVDIVDHNQAVLRRDEYKMSFLASLIRLYRDYVDFLVASGDPAAALEVVESSRARILAATVAPEKATWPGTLADLKSAARRSGSIFLSYWLAPRQSYMWLVSGTGIRQFTLPPSAEIEALVERTRQFLLEWDPIAHENPTARRLSEMLIAPAAPFIPAGSRVIIVPDGALHYLNFETLPVYSEKPHYWIEDVTVAVAPSLGIAAAPPAHPIPARSLLIIGDPVYSGKDFDQLLYSPQEISRIESRFGAARKTVITGAAANPSAYRSANPGQFSIIHFSTHGEANAQSPLDSAIILSPKDGQFKLYARDVIEVPLHADLVTISACRSAGARVYSGEGLIGFAWAFLRAGARYVVAGLWDVTDRSTPEMMDDFYRDLSSGRTPVEALRTAKLAMIHSTGAFRKPYYWGPFQIYIR